MGNYALLRMEVHPVITKMGTTRDDTYILLRRSNKYLDAVDKRKYLDFAARIIRNKAAPILVLEDSYSTLSSIISDKLLNDLNNRCGSKDIVTAIILAANEIFKKNFDCIVHGATPTYEVALQPAGKDGKYSIAIYAFISIRDFLNSKETVEKKAIEMQFEWVLAKKIIMGEVTVDYSTACGHDCVTMLLRRAID